MRKKMNLLASLVLGILLALPVIASSKQYTLMAAAAEAETLAPEYIDYSMFEDFYKQNRPQSVKFGGTVSVSSYNSSSAYALNSTNSVRACTNYMGDWTITTNVEGQKVAVKGSCNRLFAGWSALVTIDLSGLDTSAATSMHEMFYDCTSLRTVKFGGVDISRVTSMHSMFAGCRELTSVNLEGLDTSSVTSMHSMFKGCSALTSVNLEGFDTSSVTDMGEMFFECSSLKRLDLSGFSTDKVTSFYDMFSKSGIEELDISNFDLNAGVSCRQYGMESLKYVYCSDNVAKRMEFNSIERVERKRPYTMSPVMFQDIRAYAETIVFSAAGSEMIKANAVYVCDLNDAGTVKLYRDRGTSSKYYITTTQKNQKVNLDFGKNLFINKKYLTEVELGGLDTSTVQSMEAMFSGLSRLTRVSISRLDISNVTNMSDMFSDCTALTKVGLEWIDTGKVTTVYRMFANSGIKNIDCSSLDFHNVTNMESMFNGCKNLERVNMQGVDTSKVTSMAKMFASCSSLTTLNLSSFKTDEVTSVSSMFYGSGIQTLDISNMLLNSNATLTISFPSTLTSLRCPKATYDLLKSKGYLKSTVECDLVGGVPVITKQPVDIEAYDECKANLDIAAEGDGITFRWQYSDDGENWNECQDAGATSMRLVVEATEDLDGRQYRCLVVGADGDVISDVVTLTVLPIPMSIVRSPWDVNVSAGKSVEFDVLTTGKRLNFQWQSKRADTSWKNLTTEDANSNRICFKTERGDDGLMFRCIVMDANGEMAITETATLTVTDVVLGIETQPVNLSVIDGDEVSLEIEALGKKLTYQWQESKDGAKWTNCDRTGAQTEKMTWVAAESDNGLKFRCVVTDYYGEQVISKKVTILVAEAILSIVEQPADAAAESGEDVSISVKATGKGLGYQWQYSDNEGTSWKLYDGDDATTAAITISTKNEDNGTWYRCMVVDVHGNTILSSAAVLTVYKGLEITKQPEDASVADGKTATFEVEAEGKELTYQWQKSTDKGVTWANSISISAKTASLAMVTKSSYNGMQFRCVVTDQKGKTVTSEPVTLTVTAGVVITRQPEAQTVAAGGNVTFLVEADGTGLTYQWQKSSDGTAWVNSASTGAKTAALTMTTKSSFNGLSFRCVVTDQNGKKAISKAVKLTVTAAAQPVITTQPVAQTVTAGEDVSFTLVVTGTGLTYQWQKSSDGTTWVNSASTGAKTATLTMTTKSSFNGLSFRCVIKDQSGNTVTTDAVKLTVTASEAGPAIITQPVAKSVPVGYEAKFSIKATGDGLTYQWQKSSDGKTWVNSASTGAKTANLSMAVKTSFNGLYFRCVVKDLSGRTATSEAVQLSVTTTSTTTAPVIKTQPISQIVPVNGTAVFYVGATGDGLTYQWQKSSDGTTWVNSASTGAKTAALSITTKASFNGLMFRCVVTDQNGNSVKSNLVVLVVQ